MALLLLIIMLYFGCSRRKNLENIHKASKYYEYDCGSIYPVILIEIVSLGLKEYEGFEINGR